MKLPLLPVCMLALFAAACGAPDTAEPARPVTDYPSAEVRPNPAQPAQPVAEPVRTDRIEIRKDVDPGPGAWDQPEGHLAGTVDWVDVSTTKGETYLGGAIVVDGIHRQQADGVLGVDIRLHNVTQQPVEALYNIEFRSATHDVILGHKREAVSFVIEPNGYGVVGDSALTTGAIGFRLFIRSKGAVEPGYKDPEQGKP